MTLLFAKLDSFSFFLTLIIVVLNLSMEIGFKRQSIKPYVYELIASNDLLMFINADIILPINFLDAVHPLLKKRRKFLLIQFFSQFDLLCGVLFVFL
mgnify:CR=1 FL=1